LRVIHGAHGNCDPKSVERRLVKQKDTLKAWIVGEELDGKRRAGFAVDQLLILDFVAGFLEQPDRLAQIVADGFGIAADRIGVGRGEQLGRNFIADGLK
jgi:hypothetical protein